MYKKLTLILLLLAGPFLNNLIAQEIDTLPATVEGIISNLEVKNRLKISGYIQAQYQVTDSAGTKSFAGGDFATGVDKRFQLRRGRIKFQYDAATGEKGWSTSQYVLQFDVSQGGLTIKDAYVKLTDPWTGWFNLTAGMQNRPFGYEVPFSSSIRESPERGRMSQIIFPNERDLGAMITLQAPKTSRWNWIKLDVGMFNGTGAPGAGANTSDFDKFKDVIAHLGINKNSKSERVKWGLGVSYYDGGFRQDKSDQYKYGLDSAGVKGYTIDIKKADISSFTNNRDKTKRNYIGVDAQVTIDWLIGLTTLRGEYIQGEQPSTSSSSTSLSSALPTTTSTSTTYTTTIDSTTMTATTVANTTTTTSVSDVYVRKFNGAYLYFIQNIGQTPLQAIVKYDWFDANTDVAGDEIGKSVKTGYKATNSTDLKYTTLGLGFAYRCDANMKITAYYDIVKNETSASLSGYTKDLLDNVFTLRLQMKF